MPEQALIDAIAAAIASALAEHGITPVEGNPTLRRALEGICAAYGGSVPGIPPRWIPGARHRPTHQPQPPAPPKPKPPPRRNGFGKDDWVL